MVDYKKAYEKAKKESRVKQRTAKYIKWDKPGDEIIGRFISVNPVPSQRGEGHYNQYLFETNEGMVKFALGSATDREAEEIFIKDSVFAVKFLGKEDIAGGQRVNKFDIWEIVEDSELESSETKTPGSGTEIDSK